MDLFEYRPQKHCYSLAITGEEATLSIQLLLMASNVDGEAKFEKPFKYVVEHVVNCGLIAVQDRVTLQ